jgi:hypothetical protein
VLIWASRRSASSQTWPSSARRLCSLAVFCLVALFGHALHPDGQMPVAQAAWYRKQTATFRDVLAVVRQHQWNQETFCTSPTDPDVVLIPHAIFEQLSWAVCY